MSEEERIKYTKELCRPLDELLAQWRREDEEQGWLSIEGSVRGRFYDAICEEARKVGAEIVHRNGETCISLPLNKTSAQPEDEPSTHNQ